MKWAGRGQSTGGTCKLGYVELKLRSTPASLFLNELPFGAAETCRAEKWFGAEIFLPVIFLPTFGRVASILGSRQLGRYW